MTDHILAIDQGTTNTKALLIDDTGTIVASGSAALAVRYPQPGWAETTGEEIWASVEAAIAACLAGVPEATIVAIGISNQRESVLLWDRESGNTVGPCIIWQCRRSESRITPLRTPEIRRSVQQETGLDLDPLFPAAKIGWLLDETAGARTAAEKGRLCAGTVDSYLLYRLTGGKAFLTDASNASRTQLFNIHDNAWSEDLCRLFGVPAGLLPAVYDSDAAFGTTIAAAGLSAGIPVRAMIGDSHAALFAHGARAPGIIKATYGTGTSLMTLTDVPLNSKNGLSTTLAWRRGGKTFYALEGNITVSGQTAAFAARMLGLDDPDALTELARSVADSGGVVFVPALAGLGAPYWDADARGTVSGLSLSTCPAHIARAALEAIAFQVCDVASAMAADLEKPLVGILADGGAAANAFLMQCQADFLGVRVQVPAVNALSGYGAGLLAGISTGLYKEAQATNIVGNSARIYTPQLSEEVRQEKRATWARAIARTRCVDSIG